MSIITQGLKSNKLITQGYVGISGVVKSNPKYRVTARMLGVAKVTARIRDRVRVKGGMQP